MPFEFRRTGRLVCAVLVAGALSACGGKQPRLPNVGDAEADKFLFDRGSEYLAKKNWINAREYFRRLVDSYPRSQYREEAKLGIGDTYVGENRSDSLVLGANEFREFLQYFPRSERADYAQLRLGVAQFKQMLGPERDQTATHDAIRELQKFVDSYPDSKYRTEGLKLLRQARDRLGESEFKVGLLYYRIRWNQGALLRFTELLRADPDYTKRDELYFYLGETFRRLNALPEALPMYERLLKEFDKSKYRERAQKRADEVKRLIAAGTAKAPEKGPGQP